MRETWVWSLGWEDPLEKGKATHSSILAWRILWTVQSVGSQRVRHEFSLPHSPGFKSLPQFVILYPQASVSSSVKARNPHVQAHYEAVSKELMQQA